LLAEVPFEDRRFRLEREAPLFELVERDELFELVERDELFELVLRDLLRDVPDPEVPRAIASLLVGDQFWSSHTQ
jgi:hypothetical protein